MLGPPGTYLPGRWRDSEAGANPELSRNCDAPVRGGRARSPAPCRRTQPSEEGRFARVARRATSLRFTRRFFMVRNRYILALRALARGVAALVLAAPAVARHASVPTRIVSLSPTATEDLFAIGAGKQVVAVDNQSNYPAGAPKSKLS